MTASHHHIIRADGNDAALLADLHGRCFDEGWSTDFITRLLGGKGVAALIARDHEAQPIGFAIARAAADEAELLTIGVTEAQRRSGAGRQLVEAVIVTMAHREVRRLHLEVSETNHAARRLYESLDFVPVGRRPGYYENGTVDALTLAQTLRTS